MATKHYLITGNSGSGKSSIAMYLQAHGYKAIDADHEELSHWVERATGKSFSSRPTKGADWIDKFDWEWKEAAIKRLLGNETNQAIFLCGVSHNQAAFYPLFGKIFLLSLDAPTLKDRLATRTDGFGKRPGDIEAALGWHDDFQRSVLAAGGITIDAIRPIDKIAKEILSSLET